MSERLGWDEYFLELAKTVSLRADCTRRKVGAVLVGNDHRVLSVGYNGAPSGLPGCLSGACPRGRLSDLECPPFSDYGNCIAIHAERNAILYARPETRRGGTLYVTCRLCTPCHQLALAEDIRRVVWLTDTGQVAEERQYH